MNIKVLEIALSKKELAVVPLGNRLYKLCEDFEVCVKTDNGTFVYKFKKGFVTNFRSGGQVVDRFVDQIGSSVFVQVSWLIHDAAYTPCESCHGAHPISRELADRLLRETLICAGFGAFKSGLVYYAVRAGGRSAYEEDDELTAENSKLFSFELAA